MANKFQKDKMVPFPSQAIIPERDLYKRAANSTHLNRPKHASAADYRAATGFEAVIGMLEWIHDDERLEFLLAEAHKED